MADDDFELDLVYAAAPSFLPQSAGTKWAVVLEQKTSSGSFQMVGRRHVGKFMYNLRESAEGEATLLRSKGCPVYGIVSINDRGLSVCSRSIIGSIKEPVNPDVPADPSAGSW